MGGQSQVLGALARLLEARTRTRTAHSFAHTARFFALPYLLACSLAPELVGQWIFFQPPPIPPPNLATPSPTPPSTTPSLPRLLFPSVSENKNMPFRGFDFTKRSNGGNPDFPCHLLNSQ